MRSYLIRRILLIVPTLFLVTVIVFGAVRMVPGNVIDLMVAEMAVGSGMGEEVDVDHLRQILGLDKPVHIQYGIWVAKVFQGDLGDSLWSHRDVTKDLINRIPVSFELGLIALIISTIVAIPIGIYSAIRQDTVGDYLGRSVAIVALSVPNFWVGTMVIVIPSILWGWTPPIQYIPFSEDPVGNLGQFILPATIMGMNMAGGTMRMTRTMMLEVLRQDYVRTAWSKGLSERIVVVRHALRNALIPVVTQIGMRLPVLLSGAVILEQIFSLPGVGSWLIHSINSRDYPIISAINLSMATFILMSNFLVDMSYGYLDPRIRYK